MLDVDDWVAKKLTEGAQIESFTKLAPRRLYIGRRSGLPPVVVAVLSENRVEAALLVPLMTEVPQANFVVNIPKDAVIAGDAYAFAAAHGIGIGGFGDLGRALALPDMSTYVHREIAYVERAMRQHSNVVHFERLDNKRYRIHGRKGQHAVVIFLDDYELTADSVRNARDRFPGFEEVVLTNPIGTATGAAQDAVEAMGAKLVDFKLFLGRLNRL